MVDAQTIIDLLTPLSITIGVIYYVMVLRNQNKTRQIQLLMQLSDRRSEDGVRVYFSPSVCVVAGTRRHQWSPL